MPPTSPTSDPRRVYLRPARRKPGERDDARHSQVVVLKGTRKKVLCVGALHPLYSDLPTPGVLIEIEGESFRCVCGVGSYLIHSPRVLPTPRGDYFTANGRVEHGGYRERGKGRELEKGQRQRHTLHSGNRCLVQNIAIQTDRIDARRYRLASRRGTRPMAFFWRPCVMCYSAMTTAQN